MSPMKSLLYFSLSEALKKGTECPLCVMEDGLERRYMKHYLSELVMDPPSREAVMESRGFCNYHLYQMLAESSKPETSADTGAALVMGTVVEALTGDLRAQLEHDEKPAQVETHGLVAKGLLFLAKAKAGLYHLMGQKSRLARETWRMLPNAKRCPACLHRSDFAETYASEFVEILASGDSEFRRLFEASKGLCVPHYVMAVNIAEEKLGNKGRGTIKLIAEVEEKNLERLGFELKEYLRKHDYRFSREPRGPEREVLARGVAKLVGKPGLAVSSAGEPLGTDRVSGPREDSAGEYENLRTQNAYLKSTNEGLTKRSLQLESRLASLNYRAHELFEDNKRLVMRVSGLRSENETLRKMLEKHGLIRPASTAKAKREEENFRKRYLFVDKGD